MHALAGRMIGVQTSPVGELLACPPETSALLTASAQSINFEAGDIIFRQGNKSLGLYLLISGQLVKRSDRLESRIVLGYARPGEVVELAAALAYVAHTYSLVAQSEGSLLLLPIDSLQCAFENYAPLRMRLLQELAREVSRAYLTCTLSSRLRTRRRSDTVQ